MSTEIERNRSFEVDESQNRRKPRESDGILGTVIVRALISIALCILLVLSLGWTYLYTIAHGPSEAMKERFVKEAYASDSAKWLPALVLPQNEIDAILGKAGE